MATQKHLKLKEDEHRLMLENGIKAVLASQAKVLAAVESLTAQLTVLSEDQHLRLEQAKKEKRVNVAKKSTTRR